jgi:hypothetical protein
MEPRSEWLARLPDFRVTYRLFTAEEGGRKTPAYQGIRWDFRYEDKAISIGTWMIHPEFLDLKGEVFPIEPLPMLGQANMFILSRELCNFHQQYIQPGVRGYFVEGPTRVGVCEVVEVLWLRRKLTDESSR